MPSTCSKSGTRKNSWPIREDRPKRCRHTVGRVVALGQFRENAAGQLKPRSILILVEWASKEAFDSYCNDPRLADLHPHRVKGTEDYIWQLFDRLEDLRSVLK